MCWPLSIFLPISSFGCNTRAGMRLALLEVAVNSLDKLYRKLGRELAQSERSAVVHTRREARRLGDTPPARALRAVGAHALAMKPRFDALISRRQPAGTMAGRRVG